MNYEGLSDAETRVIKLALLRLGEKGEGVQRIEFDNALNDDSSPVTASLQRLKLLRNVGDSWFPTVHAMGFESDAFEYELRAVERVISLGQKMLTRGIERMPFQEVLDQLEVEFPKLEQGTNGRRILHCALFELEPFISVDSSEGNFVREVSFRAGLRRVASWKDIQREQQKDAERGIRDFGQLITGTKVVYGLAAPTPREDSRLGGLLQELEDACTFDLQIRTILERDATEVEGARQAKLHKCVLLLCGSILEGVLVSILNKRPELAQPAFAQIKKNKSFPDDASLPDLMALSLASLGADLRPLLGQEHKRIAQTVIDHRDLIHPHREMRRTELKITKHSAELLYDSVCVVLHELSEAIRGGWLTDFKKP